MDLLLHRMADMMKNQFGLKPKNQTFSYRMPFPNWYHRVALPTGVKILEFTKFTSRDGTSTIEHVSRYLMQLGEASGDEAFRVRYFSLSLAGPAFTWITTLPADSIETWADLEEKFHAYFFTGTSEKKLVNLASVM